MKLNKVSLTIIFACCMILLIHFFYTSDLEKRTQRLHREMGKFILTFVDERVRALGISSLDFSDEEFFSDLIISISDYFDLEEVSGILVFDTMTGALIYPSGTIKRSAPQDIFSATGEGIEGEIRLEDRFGYFVKYSPLNMTLMVYTLKSDLFVVRNQLLVLAAVLIFLYALILLFMDLRIRRRFAVVLKVMKNCFERAFVKRGKLLESIEPQGESRIDDVVTSYNTMVMKAEKIFGQMENRIHTLFQQRENLKKIIALYKKYSQSEAVLKISEKNISDLESKRQKISSLSIELVNYLEPIDGLYPQVITNELSALYNFVKSQAVGVGGMINFSYGYFLNIVYGAPTADEQSFMKAIEGSQQILKWIEGRNSSEKNVSGVKWEAKMGLSHGTSVAGTVGDSYVGLGVAVEESMRMLGYAGQYGVTLVTNAEEQLNTLKDFKFRKLDVVQDATSEGRINIFEIFLQEPEQIENAVKLYYHGLDMFLEGKYDIAVFDFKKVNQIFDGDNPSLLFIKRCERLIKNE